MKSKIHILTTFISLTIFSVYGQINTEIIDVLVNNQDYVSNCNSIDLEDNNSISLTIYFKLTKPSNQAVGTATVEALLKYSSSSSGSFKGSYTVQSNSWSNNTEFYGQIPISVSANEIQVTGSSILIETTASGSSDSNSCEYPLEKDEVPSFSLAPTNTTVHCQNPTVNNFYIIL